MQAEDPIGVARQVIERHGIRAAAVAEERATEARLAGNAAELDRWQSVQLLIAELRRTAGRKAA
ncbi:MAG: hypothetical protein M0002_03555 [Rhodospirillales bacterium]|nr:hypothetical protein [Rhodospirillales bacterium]